MQRLDEVIDSPRAEALQVKQVIDGSTGTVDTGRVVRCLHELTGEAKKKRLPTKAVTAVALAATACVTDACSPTALEPAPDSTKTPEHAAAPFTSDQFVVSAKRRSKQIGADIVENINKLYSVEIAGAFQEKCLARG